MTVSHPLAAPLRADGTPDGRADVGIAGAGQLARMTCLAAWPLGWVLGFGFGSGAGWFLK